MRARSSLSWTATSATTRIQALHRLQRNLAMLRVDPRAGRGGKAQRPGEDGHVDARDLDGSEHEQRPFLRSCRWPVDDGAAFLKAIVEIRVQDSRNPTTW